MYLTRAQPHGRPLPAAAANASSHTEHSHRQSRVQITLRDLLGWPAASDLSMYHSKTAAQSHYRKTIGLKLSAGAIVVRYDSTMGLSPWP